jgi:hypothetical protein
MYVILLGPDSTFVEKEQPFEEKILLDAGAGEIIQVE